MSQSDKHSIKLEQEPQGDLDNIDNMEQADPSDDNNEQEPGNGGSLQTFKKRSHRKLDISNFIMKTYRILEDRKNGNIVEWTEGGDSFIVKDKERFSKEILPKYFKHSKFSSFVRQLNMYDFHKIRKQKEIPIFKHKFFQEGRLDLLPKIKRKSGEECKQQQPISKELMNFSEPAIESKIQLSYNNIKPSLQVLPGSGNRSEGDLLRRENSELMQSINDINQEISMLELSRERKKEKLVKIVTSIVFFDLNVVNGQESSSHEGSEVASLRGLLEHFVGEQEPFSFSEYRSRLSKIYHSLRDKIML